MLSPAIQFFLDRPKVVSLLLLGVLLAGITSLDNLSYEYNPMVDLGVVNVTTARFGSGPEDIELSITLPLEEELMKVDGIDKMYSSSMEGLSLLTLRLAIDIGNKQQVLGEIQKAVDRASARLPGDLLEKPRVEELSTQLTPVIELHLKGNVSEEFLRSASRKVTEGVREVEGVAGVRTRGYRRKEVKIYLQPEKLDQLGISLDEIRHAIAARNVRDSGGSLSSFSAEKKVIAVGQFESPKDVESVVVRAFEPGNAVHIRDVATVVSDFEDWDIESITDGQRSIVLQVLKQAGADELHTAADVRAFAQEMASQLPEGVELVTVNDISRLTVQMLDTLVGNALLGFFLVLIILNLTMSQRLAFWIAVGIPFSILVTFLGLYALGITINAISLTAIILMIGVLVDDAVVVGESIERQREQGRDPFAASVEGTLRVAKPVFFAILTTILAFLPILGLGGSNGEFLKDFPITIMVILAASLFECFLLLPSHLARSKLPDARRVSMVLTRYGRRYQTVVIKLIRRPKASLGMAVVGFSGIVMFGVLTIPVELYPALDIDTVNIKVELPAGAQLSETRRKVAELERLVREEINQEDLLNILVQLGHHDTDMYGASEGRDEAWALLIIHLKPLGQRDTNTHQLVEDLRGQLADFAGVSSLVVETQSDVPVMGKAVEVEVISNNHERVVIAADLQNFLQQHPHVTHTWSSYRPGKDVVEVDFDTDLLAARGLTVQQVTDSVRVALDGILVDELQTVDERIYYRLQYPPHRGGQLEALDQMRIVNSEGDLVFLNSVAEFLLRSGEADIKHYQGRRTVTVYADIDREESSVEQINQEIAAYVAEQGFERKYPDVRIWQTGELEETRDTVGSFGQALILCLMAIFFALVLLFGSYVHPLLILLCLPFGMTGVIIGFGLHGMALGVVAFTGVIGMLGILVNDSLVMVTTLNRLGDDRDRILTDEDIAEGAALRFRPIVVTSLTTVAGLVPTAYGFAGSNSYVSPIVMAMTWGSMFGLFVTLFILPCLFTLDRDFRRWQSTRKAQAG